MNQSTLFQLPDTESTPRIIPMRDGAVTLTDGFFSREESADFFARLHAETKWRQDHIQINGKTIPLPRLQAWYGDQGRTYRYSGIKLQPEPWTPTLALVRDRIKARTAARANSVLLNLYRDGKDSVSYHADNEPGLGELPIITSVSFGETRLFRLKHLRTGQTVDIPLHDGSLLVMYGETQRHWHHCIPKTAKLVGPRINLTYRYIYPPEIFH